MSGLLIRELKLRGLAERILVVCPANLAFQWQRELKEKFDEKFFVLKGGDLRDQFGVNQWLEQPHVITSLDLAKRSEVLPGLRQVRWDLVIVDEAHRMSWTPPARKTGRYALGELLRDTADHLLLLTATPHKGDPENFSLFLQLLDADAYADVRSIREAMERRRAPFYLRRTKEAMVHFPERRPDGTWAAEKIFTRRIPHTVAFRMDGAEHDLYQEVSRFVKRQSAKAAARGDDPRARAVGFLMSLYQRRLASSTHALRKSLENRARRLEEGLKQAEALARAAPAELPGPDEIEEMEEGERERLEGMLEAVTLAANAEQIREEVAELRHFAGQARAVEASRTEAKLVWNPICSTPACRVGRGARDSAARNRQATAPAVAARKASGPAPQRGLLRPARQAPARLHGVPRHPRPSRRPARGLGLCGRDHPRRDEARLARRARHAAPLRAAVPRGRDPGPGGHGGGGRGDQPPGLPRPLQLRHPLEPQPAGAADGPHPPLWPARGLPHLQLRGHEHDRRPGAATAPGQAPGDPRRAGRRRGVQRRRRGAARRARRTHPARLLRGEAGRRRPRRAPARKRGRGPLPQHLPQRPGRAGLEEAQPRHAHRTPGAGAGTPGRAGDHRALPGGSGALRPLQARVEQDPSSPVRSAGR